jgi:two-component system, NarL family, response regulator DevR
MSVRLAVVDDRPLVRAGVGAALVAPLIAECSTIGEARARLPGAKPTVSIIRSRLPDGSGLELCRWLRASLPDHRTLIVHDGATRRDLMEAIDAGAAGFVSDDIALAELRDAVAHLGSGLSLLDGAAFSRLAAILPAGTDQLLAERLATLSERQLAITELVAQGLRNVDIAAELGLTEQTVKNQVTRILTALGFERRAQLARALGAQTHVETR